MEENRFKRLRYSDKECLHQEISMTKLAEKMEISKATISKIESEPNYDARISIIKKYKEQFPDVSYDYLLGATNTRYKQYNPIEEKLPFENDFYISLENLIATTHPDNNFFHIPHDIHTGEDLSQSQLELLFNAFIKDGDALHTLLLKTFNFMIDLYTVKNLSENSEHLLSFHTESELENAANFGISQAYLDFVHNSLYEYLTPHLKKIVEHKYEHWGEPGYMDIPDDVAPF